MRWLAAFVCLACAPAPRAAPMHGSRHASIPSDPRCTRDGWCLESPGLTVNDLHGIDGSGPRDVYAVGDRGVVVHFDGDRWRLIDTGTSDNLQRVRVHAPNDVFVISSTNRLLHFDGVHWTARATALRYPPGDVWSDGRRIFLLSGPRIVRSTPIGWVDDHFERDGGIFSCFGGRDSIFAAGSQAIVRRDGSGWHRLPMHRSENDLSESVRAMWQSGRELFAVGWRGRILHYDGTEIAAEPSGIDETLIGIWGAHPDDVFAVSENASVLHYDGTTWVVRSPGVQTTHLNAAWGYGREIFGVGAGGLIVRYEHAHWSSIGGGADVAWNDVWTRGGSAVAVGERGTISMLESGVWRPVQPRPTEAALRAVSGSDIRSLVAVGARGSILRFDGSQWAAIASPTQVALNDVWASRADAFIVGEDGVILRLENARSYAMHSGTALDLRAVWGSAANDVFAVGDGGTVLHFDGTSWGAQASATRHPLAAIWGRAHDDVYAVGAAGVVVHYDGAHWRAIDGAPPMPLSSVWGDRDGIVVAGSSATVARLERRWSVHDTRTMLSFHALAGDEHGVLLVGERGAILRHAPRWRAGRAVSVRPVPAEETSLESGEEEEEIPRYVLRFCDRLTELFCRGQERCCWDNENVSARECESEWAGSCMHLLAWSRGDMLDSIATGALHGSARWNRRAAARMLRMFEERIATCAPLDDVWAVQEHLLIGQLALGEDCFSRDVVFSCAPGLVCASDDRCAFPARRGQRCGWRPCGAGLYCPDETGERPICRAVPREGAPCRESFQCANALCENGRCGPPDLAHEYCYP